MSTLPNEEITPTAFIGGGMSGPEHYETAEELLQYASEVDESNPEELWIAAQRIQAAQVHATLALAAATALGSLPAESQALLPDNNEWLRVAGVES